MDKIRLVLDKEERQVEEYDKIRMSIHTFEVAVDRAREELESCKKCEDEAAANVKTLGDRYVESAISMGFCDEKRLERN